MGEHEELVEVDFKFFELSIALRFSPELKFLDIKALGQIWKWFWFSEGLGFWFEDEIWVSILTRFDDVGDRLSTWTIEIILQLKLGRFDLNLDGLRFDFVFC